MVFLEPRVVDQQLSVNEKISMCLLDFDFILTK